MKENKRKQKSESFDQGKFVPNVLDKVYAQLGISANQEKVSRKKSSGSFPYSSKKRTLSSRMFFPPSKRKPMF
jgi:hypothetical protein